ncbi:hypothetical protein ABIB35_002457 [Arthrobacter sp. UYP6]
MFLDGQRLPAGAPLEGRTTVLEHLDTRVSKLTSGRACADAVTGLLSGGYVEVAAAGGASWI